MRHHLLVPSCVAALVPSLVSGAALGAPDQFGTVTIDVSFDHSIGSNHSAASDAVTFAGSAAVDGARPDVDPGDAARTDRSLAAVPEPDSAGVWAALAGLAALAASRPAGGRRGR